MSNFCSQTITVTNLPTVINCSTNKTIPCNSNLVFNPPTVVSPCCGTNYTISTFGNDVTTNLGPCSHSVTRKWLITDCCGLSNFCSQTITVVDSTLPVIHYPDNITRYGCTNCVKVYYKASASDVCSPPVTLTYNPPSGSMFCAGVTNTVTVTATDACGNSNTCTFTVRVVDNSIWQTFAAGINDCFKYPYDPVIRSVCLNNAYPAANWKPFDDKTRNRYFGYSWLSLPNNILEAYVTNAMLPNCKLFSHPQDDTISFGLNNCSPANWLWSRYIGAGNLSTGLLSSTWCNQGLCGTPFSFNLANMPLTGANLLPHMNSTHRLDMFVQNDTGVDYAWLRVRYCPPQPIINGLPATLTSAIIANGWNTYCLAPDPTINATNYAISLGLGDTPGVKAGLDTTSLYVSSNSAVALLLKTVMPDTSTTSFGLLLMPTGAVVRCQLVADTGTNGGQVVLRLQGAQVASQSFGPGQLPPPLELKRDDGTVDSITFSQGSNVVLHLNAPTHVTGAFGSVIADELVFAAAENQWLGGFCPYYLDIAVTNVSEIGLHDHALEINGQYLTVTGEAIARAVTGNLNDTVSQTRQVTIIQDMISLLDNSNPQFGTVAVTMSTAPTNEFRAPLGTPFGVITPPTTNSSLALTARGIAGGIEQDLPTMHFSYTGSNWNVTASSAGVPVPLARVQVWSNGVLVANVPNAASLQLAELPQVHWPTIIWFVDDDICHRFAYSSATTVLLNGAAYTATEVRVLTATSGQPLQALTGETISAVLPDVLAVSGLITGPEVYQMDPPEFDTDSVFIRWLGLGGVLESAPVLSQPWTVWPVLPFGNEVVVPLGSNSPPMQFFRVRGN